MINLLRLGNYIQHITSYYTACLHAVTELHVSPYTDVGDGIEALQAKQMLPLLSQWLKKSEKTSNGSAKCIFHGLLEIFEHPTYTLIYVDAWGRR